MKKLILYFWYILILLLVFNSCSTKKNTGLVRFYHNTTAHFNIYFNGFESFKRGMKTIEQTPENYTQLLPVFKNEREDVMSAISGDMDESIIKSVKMIKMHSITTKPEHKKPKKGKRAYALTDQQKEFYSKNEYNKWVDDAYLLIGKAHYFKGDYQGGFRSLHLILNKFRKDEIRFYAMYWIARSYSAMHDFNEADNYLNLITDDKTHPEDLNYGIDMCYADIYIKQKKYQEAVGKLDYLISITKKKKKRARLKYITAQLYQKLNKGDKAIELFAEVIKMNPPYEMAFSAKINMAKSFINSSEGSEKIRKLLAKMLKDDKNIDFQDQIYYVLAGVEYKEGNEDQALNYYHKSVNTSVSNQNQKALSYLALADIYFERRSYLPAGEYYDSTMSVLDTKYPDYDMIAKKTKNLKELTDNLKLIAHEDSLQRIASMDSVKRNEYIQSIIDRLIAEERAANNPTNIGNHDQFNRGDYNPNQTRGKWYFYNPQALSIGKSEFMKIWGKRKSEDHWRRKNKRIILDELEDDETQESDSGRITDNKKIEFYLQDLPLTDSLITLSDERIARAYFDAGVVYERKMEDYEEAVESYNTLIKRFPEYNLNVEAYFNMYLIYFNKTKNKSLAEKNRNNILNKYPYSKYAKILSDPNYLNILKQNKNKIDKLYAEAYESYKKNKYSVVIKKTEEAFNVSKQNHLEAKFLYLKGMAKGCLGDVKKMEEILKILVKNYPKDEVSPLAQNVLDLLKSGKYDPDYYEFKTDSVYYYTIVVNKKDTLANKIKYILTTYNVSAFPKSNFKTEVFDLGEDKTAITIKTFADDVSAVNYLNNIKNSNSYKDIPVSYYNDFIISDSNSEKLKKLPILDKYLSFYKSHY